MRPYEPLDELDRALFALPLEETPHDLHAAILGSTIYRPAFPVKPWEIWTIATVVAFAAWLCIAVARGAFPQLANAENAVVQAFAAPAAWPVLFWILVGAAATAWFSQLPLTLGAGYVRTIQR